MNCQETAGSNTVCQLTLAIVWTQCSRWVCAAELMEEWRSAAEPDLIVVCRE